MNKKKIIGLICFILLIGLGPMPLLTIGASETVKIGTDHLNIREGPGLSYPVVQKAQKGEEYPFLSEKQEWIEIQLDNGKKGWVANWLVSKKQGTTNSSTQSQSTSNKAIVMDDGLRIRKGPGTEYQVIGTANKGDSFAVLSTNGNWVQLDTSFGVGWASTDYVQLKNTATKNLEDTRSSGTVTSNVLNIRSTPSLNGSIIGKLSAGDTITILSQSNGWTEISYSGTKAWVSSQYVQTDSTPDQSNKQSENVSTQSDKKGKGTVTATTLVVRNTGSLNGKSIGSVTKGQSFTILEEVNNWAKIEFKKDTYGWVASWYLDTSSQNGNLSSKQVLKDSTVTILHDGTNIRKSANTSSSVVQRANEGEAFKVISVQNDWYEIQLSNGGKGFIAGWIVSVNGSAPSIDKSSSTNNLKNKNIVIDPGHGGRDNGTTGASGTNEKSLTLKTAQLLSDKLKATGANVILTRSSDSYIPLSSRVYASHYHNADAFISIHYDSINDRSVRGLTTYYYHSYQKALAADVHSSIASQSRLKNRDYRFGDYYVLRENKNRAILLELGYLSNPSEEILVTTKQFQEVVTNGILQGLVKHFK
ncbi:N-acetylmuramoyl-L-alanine amidase [Cytobacillus eiseniae]|uniref:N-acetylmuramoyl-L-alanine amidase n=1 Tax=Cytobacillus eiseniae TaxID=762947 RepID=A0ABS4RCW9_9BACI|nr:SH3 domain-containing protein [Cytobacillus eiseniae]MBP2240544.1 N-acetylmuramoyl-L-alanine amidase [Cytobacillus eiseniae]